MKLHPLAQDLAGALDPVLLCERIGMVPDEWQADVLRSRERRIALAIGRQVGKSTVASILAVHQAVYVPGSLVLAAAPSLARHRRFYR